MSSGIILQPASTWTQLDNGRVTSTVMRIMSLLDAEITWSVNVAANERSVASAVADLVKEKRAVLSSQHSAGCTFSSRRELESTCNEMLPALTCRRSPFSMTGFWRTKMVVLRLLCPGYKVAQTRFGSTRAYWPFPICCKCSPTAPNSSGLSTPSNTAMLSPGLSMTSRNSTASLIPLFVLSNGKLEFNVLECHGFHQVFWHVAKCRGDLARRPLYVENEALGRPSRIWTCRQRS